MGDDIGSGLSSMAVCFDFRSTNVVQLSNRNPYFYRFRCHLSNINKLSSNLSTIYINKKLFRPEMVHIHCFVTLNPQEELKLFVTKCYLLKHYEIIIDFGSQRNKKKSRLIHTISE